jgi:hypothetical protein
MDPKKFKNPPDQHRPTPFWYWNGAIEESDISRQIREMKDKGLGGFIIASRSGLKIPYLSQTWYDRVTHAVEVAAKEDLSVWLHDDFPSPRSRTGGRVALSEPRYRAQYLTYNETTVQGGQQVDMALPWAALLRAIAVPLKRDKSLWEDAEDISAYIGTDHQQERYVDLEKEEALYRDRSYHTRDPIHRLFWKAPAGRWRVIVFLQKEIRGEGYSTGHFDPYSRDAVLTYIRSTFEPYVERLKTHIGKTVKGIHTTRSGSSEGYLPWSSVLPEAFQAIHGYDLVSQLPALITAYGPNTSRIRYDYFRTLSDLLDRSYHLTCSEWAYNQGLTFNTDALRYRSSLLDKNHTHGIKSSTDKATSAKKDETPYAESDQSVNPVFHASASRQSGRESLFANTFDGAGWSLNPQDIKQTVDRLAAQGCSKFNFEGFAYTIDGSRKHDVAPSLFHQNPYWKDFGQISDYLSRLSYALSQGDRHASIVVMDPVTSFMAHIGNPERRWSYAGSDPEEEKLAERLRADWATLLQTLSRSRISFDLIDSATLAKAKVKGKQLFVGKIAYDTLVLPPITNLERGAFDAMRNFLNEGGNVVSVSLLPIEDIEEGASVVEGISRISDMEAGRMIKDYMGHELGVHLVNRENLHLVRTGGSVLQNDGARALADLLAKLHPREIVIHAEQRASSAILTHHRRDKGQDLFFVANTTNMAFDATVGLLKDGVRLPSIELWDIETGERCVQEPTSEGDHAIVPMRFEAYQSRLIIVGGDTVEPDPEPDLIELPIRGNWRIDLEDDNALRIDRFRMQVDTQGKGQNQGWHTLGYSDSRWANVSPRPFGDQIRENTPSSLPLNYTQSGSAPNVELPLVVWYRASFQADLIPNKLALVKDRGAIEGNYQIFLNGTKLPNNSFRPTFRYDQNNLTCALGRRVVKGKNQIAVRVEINSLSDGLIDAFYLFGKFGVRKWKTDGHRVGALPERGTVASLDANRLPYYAGTVSFTHEIPIKKPAGKTFMFDLNKEFKDTEDVVEVLVNGHSMGSRLWSPYKWVGQSAWIKTGKNRITIKCTNTLSRLLTGKRFNHRAHRIFEVKA